MCVTAEELAVIERVALALGYQYTFDIWEIEDIEQDVRLFCLQALPHFANQCPLEEYLRRHARNRLIAIVYEYMKG